MGRTTIQIRQKTKELLREERQGLESNYDDTILRLLGEGPDKEGGRSREEIKEIVQEVVES